MEKKPAAGAGIQYLVCGDKSIIYMKSRWRYMRAERVKRDPCLHPDQEPPLTFHMLARR
jgi:hypothetical protein